MAAGDPLISSGVPFDFVNAGAGDGEGAGGERGGATRA